MAEARASSRGSVFGRGDLVTSFILILPLFIAYQVGVIFSSSINGVDFVTRTVFAAVDHDHRDYLLVQLVVAVAYVGLVIHARRRGVLSRQVVLPMVLESAIYALTLGSFIILIMQELLGFALDGGVGMALGKTGEALVISLGAGVHEEIVFRLGVMGGGAALLRRTGMYTTVAVPIALFVSAALFSFAHHLGPYGEAFHLDVFVYRVLAGIVFGLIFFYRSLAHAVYTHFLYDLYVLAIRP